MLVSLYASVFSGADADRAAAGIGRGDGGTRMQTTTIALDEDTHRRLRRLALDQRTSFRELIRTAIAEYLRRHEGGRS